MITKNRVEEIISSIGPLDAEAMKQSRARQDQLTKPQGSLGVLEDLSVRLAGIYGRPVPIIEGKAIIVMAADHGVARKGVSAYPQEVTGQMVGNFASGGAAINVLARHCGAKVYVVDVGVASDARIEGVVDRKVRPGTADITEGPAMSRAEALQSIEAGIEAVGRAADEGASLLGTGDMGIGNTTASSAVVAALTGRSASEVVGRGTGVDDEGLVRKIAAIEQALCVNLPASTDALDVLTKVGGFELGGICGVILGAAARRLPVVIDGFISGAGALLAARLAPACVNYMVASHVSVEPGHRIVLEEIGLQPMLYMNMRLGEGTGAALAVGLLEAATRVLAEMATFAEASVSEKAPL